MSTFLTAEEVTSQLDITKATLYSYVSRGLLRSEPSPENPRKRQYRQEDVDALLRKKELKRHPEKTLKSSLYWGEPLMDSGVSLIQDGLLYYGGKPLSHWLDRGYLHLAEALWQTPVASVSPLPMPCLPEGLSPYVCLQMALPWWASQDYQAWNLSPKGVQLTLQRLLGGFFALLGGPWQSPHDWLPNLLNAWQVPPDRVPVFERVLILCAEHELNISTFSARCVFSAQSTPYEAFQAGLAALRGQSHGGQIEGVLDFVAHTSSLQSELLPWLAKRLRLQDPIPGLGHPLYPQGDPRWILFYQGLAPDETHFLEPLLGAFETLALPAPNIDFIWAALSHIYGLNASQCLTLFALGRSLGWGAHLLEQGQQNKLIRPRARYNGPKIEEVDS